MARKRRQPFRRPRRILWFLLTANVVAGALYSPITSVVRARVDGAPEFDHERLSGILRKLKDVPITRVRAAAVESEAMHLPEVRSARLSRNIFGRALLVVGYRRPVARIRNTNNLGLTIDGVLYPAHALPERLPVVSVPDRLLRPKLTLASNWEVVAVARLAAEAQETWPDSTLAIDLDPRGSLCLNMGTGRVVLGAARNLDEKLDVLRKRLARNPNELAEVRELNLTAPENPAIVPK